MYNGIDSAFNEAMKTIKNITVEFPEVNEEE